MNLHTLYRYFDVEGRLLYIGVTRYWPERNAQHRRYSPWWAQARRCTRQSIVGRMAAEQAERAAIRAERPLHNKAGVPA